MLDSNNTNGDVDCLIESNAHVVKPQCANSISISAVPPNNSRILSDVVSDMKKLNEEIRAILQLKSELRTSQDRLSQTASILHKPVKGPDTSGNKSALDLIRSDIKKLNDDMYEIRILKSELALYQSRISRKVFSLKMKEI